MISLLEEVARGNVTRLPNEQDEEDVDRAITGLFELQLERGDWKQAASKAELHCAHYMESERPARSLDWCRRALDLGRKSGDAANSSRVELWIALDLVMQGKLDEALVAVHEARMSLPPLHNSVGFDERTWNLELQLLVKGKNFAGAHELLLASQHSKDGTPAPPIVKCWAMISEAYILLAQDKSSEVIPALEKALQLPLSEAERKEAVALAGWELSWLVDAIMNRVPYSTAVELARQVEQLQGPLTSAVDFASQAHRAIQWRRMLAGELDDVLREANEKVTNAALSGSSFRQTEALRELASCWEIVHSTSNQIAALEEARDIARKSPLMATMDQEILVDLGHAYIAARRFPEAKGVLETVVSSIDAEPSPTLKLFLAPVRMAATIERAEAMRLSGSGPEARAILDASLRRQQALERRHYDREAQLLLALARSDRDQDPDAALRYYKLAIEASSKFDALLFQPPWELFHPNTFQDRQINKLSLQLEIARLLADQGHWQAAREYLNAAAAGIKTENLAGSAWQLAFLSGFVAEGEGRQTEALADYKRAVTEVEALRGSLSQVEHRLSFSDNEQIAELNRRLVALLTRMNLQKQAWQYVERGKARSFVESLEGKRFDRPASGRSAPKSLLDLDSAVLDLEIRALRKRISDDGLASSRGSAQIATQNASRREELRAAEIRSGLLREQSALSARRATQAVQLDPPTVQELQTKLGPSTALVEFAILPDALTAFVITRGTFEQLHWKIAGAALEQDVSKLRGYLGNPSSAQYVQPLLANVSAAVWNPVVLKFAAAVNRLIIVPAGYLNYLPFQALMMPDGRSAIDRYTISYLPSASTLMLIESPKRSSDLFLGALGSVRVEHHAPLPATLDEVAGIARVYPQAQVVEEAALTHDAALQALMEHDQVHFATHGVFDAQAPLFSALLVSGDAGWHTRLSMYELVGQPIRAKLVVLSACETGVGKLFRGDEVVGLTRTLLSAGAETVVSSLWQVNDKSTALLMEEFYRGLSRDATPADALRGAALAVRSKYPDPMYWAPFVVTGAE